MTDLPMLQGLAHCTRCKRSLINWDAEAQRTNFYQCSCKAVIVRAYDLERVVIDLLLTTQEPQIVDWWWAQKGAQQRTAVMHLTISRIEVSPYREAGGANRFSGDYVSVAWRQD